MKIHRQLSSAIQAAHGASGLPTPPAWGGYWNWVSATIILAFIMYTAQKGTLNKWVSFFAWSTPQGIGSAGGQAAGANAANTSIATGTQPTTPSLWNFLTGNWYESTAGNATPVTTPAPGLGSGGIGSA